MEGILVRLHDVNLRARLAADVVCIAVVIEALRLPRILMHRGHVEGGVATAIRLGDVDGIRDLLVQQLQGQVVSVVVAPCASVGEVGAPLHMRHHLAAVHFEVADLGRPGRSAPASGHDGHSAVARHLELARALVRWPSRRHTRSRRRRRRRRDHRRHHRCAAHRPADRLVGPPARCRNCLRARGLHVAASIGPKDKGGTAGRALAIRLASRPIAL
mmetsp:Transcript_84943/g.243774  ORF Transcript_84943/g.243774 Transcript_84943/m.243774 type:complete len:216 (-) Transcript_84943:98-745(-)